MLFRPDGLFDYFWSKVLNKILIIGWGDIGQRLAKRWQQYDSLIYSLSRRPQTNTTKHIVADLDQSLDATPLESKGAIIYYLAPPPNEGSDDPRLKNLLTAIKPSKHPKRFIYISTSGVYGDHQGGEVDESTPATPQTKRSQRRWAAEQAVQEWGERHQVNTVILRVGGIYGPNRLPTKRIKQGMAVLRRDLAPPTNRIHADDLAQICEAAAQAPAGHQIYNVCDMQASSMSDYFFAVAEQAKLPPPREVDWQEAETEISPAMISYLRESRRMNNHKMLSELNIILQYPTLADGLASCFKQETTD